MKGSTIALIPARSGSKEVLEGKIDWRMLSRELATLAPNASFIPEIWQGHKNRGEGFWQALELLEPYF